MDYRTTPEKDEKGRLRRKARLRQPADPLAERARLIAFWRRCAVTNWAYNPPCGAWWRPFVTQPGLRRLLMPKLRAMLDARDRAKKEKFAAEAKESARRAAIRKAERAAEKARASSPQAEIFS